MADRTVATTDTLDTLRTTYNSTAGDVGDISGVTGASGTISGVNIGASGIVFEGATADAYETTLTVADPTADRVITIPNSTMTCVTTATHATTGTHISKCIALG